MTNATATNPFSKENLSPTQAEVAKRERQQRHGWKMPALTMEERRKYRALCEKHGALEARRIMFGDVA